MAKDKIDCAATCCYCWILVGAQKKQLVKSFSNSAFERSHAFRLRLPGLSAFCCFRFGAFFPSCSLSCRFANFLPFRSPCCCWPGFALASPCCSPRRIASTRFFDKSARAFKIRTLFASSRQNSTIGRLITLLPFCGGRDVKWLY